MYSSDIFFFHSMVEYKIQLLLSLFIHLELQRLVMYLLLSFGKLTMDLVDFLLLSIFLYFTFLKWFEMLYNYYFQNVFFLEVMFQPLI